jgi:hypothetical protein
MGSSRIRTKIREKIRRKTGSEAKVVLLYTMNTQADFV